jgi:hypothetical protein
MLTVLDRTEALQKLMRYFSEKVRTTLSIRLIVTSFSGLSVFVFCRRETEPLPMSPEHVNLTVSLEASMVTGAQTC